MKQLFTTLGVVIALLCTPRLGFSQAIVEDFTSVASLPAAGWAQQNLSSPLGLSTYVQGVAASSFNAYNGGVNDFIVCNFNSTTGGSGTISNWLFSPNRTIRNGDVYSFYTRTSGDIYPDRVEVRLSTNGASTNAGTSATSVGDFTTLLLSINPSLVIYGYPSVWTQYTITISGLPAPVSGRLAFRYFVTGAGPSGSNSDIIGIDAFRYTPYTCPTLTVSPAGALPNGTAGVAYSQSVSQTGALGAPTYTITSGALPPGMTMSPSGVISGTPTATGTYNFSTVVSDNSGCSSAAQPQSITIVCPVGGASMSTLPVLCSNAAPYTLTQGSPAGGTYSGTGVTAGQFNPAVGTQTITYTLVDGYSCTQTASASLVVNTAPAVSIPAFSAVCVDASPVTLSGATPAGGTYSGTNVSGGQFNPSGGTQTITYTYTDANGCTNSDTEPFTVNALPSVNLSPLSATCNNASPVTLSGGSPAGGTYSGTGVSAGMFDPSVGTQTITYAYTDANGCSNTDAEVITVNNAPAVSFSALTPVCDNAAPVTLSGGSPAGGTYSGTGVSAGMFNPTAGTQTITYSYTDANGCTNTSTQVQNVGASPVVTLAVLPHACTNGGLVTLSGGSPAGGTYSGTGVSGGQFNPSAGTQTITYSYTDGSGCSGTDNEVITVNTPPTVNLNGSSTVVCLSDGAVTLTGTPSGGTYYGNAALSANTFNPGTAGVGTHVISYRFTDVTTGCSDTATFSITVNGCAGIEDQALNASLQLYPNPADAMVVLNLDMPGNDENCTLEIFTMDGRSMYKKEIWTVAGHYTETLDVSEYASGAYFVQIKNMQGATVTKKFIRK